MAFTTGSRANRAMECIGSTVLSRVSEQTDDGIKGTWKHDFLRAVKQHKPLEEALAAVPAEYREACESLDVDAIKGLEVLEAELELSYNVKSRVARRDVPPELTDFDDVYAKTDLGGVMQDGAGESVVCVIDVKTGRHDVEAARINWQLLCAAVALSQLHQISKARVGILYLREAQRARWDIADLDAVDLDTAAVALEQLRERHERARKKDETPPLRTGSWCRYCPSKLYCPAHVALIKLFATDQLGAVTSIKELLTPALAREAKAKADLVRAALKNLDNALYSYARETGGIKLGNGRVWGPRVVPRDELDAELAYETLKADYGLDVAIAASKFEVTKKGINDAMRVVQKSVVDAGGKKPTLVELEGQTFGRLRAVGALNKVEKEVFEEYQADEATTPPSKE